MIFESILSTELAFPVTTLYLIDTSVEMDLNFSEYTI